MDWVGVAGDWSVSLALFDSTLRARREHGAVQGELTDRWERCLHVLQHYFPHVV